MNKNLNIKFDFDKPKNENNLDIQPSFPPYYGKKLFKNDKEVVC